MNILCILSHNPGHIDFGGMGFLRLAEQLKSNGQNSYVVGHSNTTPELARLLCECSIVEMDESEYDRLIVISIDDGKVHAEILNQGDLFN